MNERSQLLADAAAFKVLLNEIKPLFFKLRPDRRQGCIVSAPRKFEGAFQDRGIQLQLCFPLVAAAPAEPTENRLQRNGIEERRSSSGFDARFSASSGVYWRHNQRRIRHIATRPNSRDRDPDDACRGDREQFGVRLPA